jgi:hypothetical protein
MRVVPKGTQRGGLSAVPALTCGASTLTSLRDSVLHPFHHLILSSSGVRREPNEVEGPHADQGRRRHLENFLQKPWTFHDGFPRLATVSRRVHTYRAPGKKRNTSILPQLALARILRYPPSPRSCGMRRLGRKSRDILEATELIGKIFRIKDLASAAVVFQEHAKRVSFA